MSSSAVDLSDPHISMAYDALVHNDPLRWFLLAYGNKQNGLSLCASGTGDVDELRSHLSPGSVYYGIFRERTQDKSLHVSLNYIPDSVRGVWRARALVTGNAVSSKFKAHQVLNASNPDQVTVQAFRSILRLPPRVPQGLSAAPALETSEPSHVFSSHRKPAPEIRTSLSIPRTRTRTRSSSLSPTDPSPQVAHPRSVSSPLLYSFPFDPKVPATSAPDATASPTGDSPSYLDSAPAPSYVRPLSPPAQIVTTFPLESAANLGSLSTPLVNSPLSISMGPSSSFPTEGRTPQDPHSPQHTSWLLKKESPLPLPPPEEPEDVPSDVGELSHNSDDGPASPYMETIPDSQSVASLDSSGHASSPAPTSPILSHSFVNGSSARDAEPEPRRIVDGLPASSVTSSLMTSQQETNLPHSKWTTKEDFVDLASNRKRSRFQERASLGSTADMEEERKLAVLEEERRRRAAERAKREKEEREEEEAREREFEERKEREKRRRLESARRAEERRIEQKRQQDEEEAHQRAEKEKKEEEIRQRRNRVQQRFEKQNGVDLLSGFITIGTGTSWKRRYYRLSTEDWVFFKSDKETTTPMHVLDLSRVRALREWYEGYDELEAIPHSFAVEFKGEVPWMLFADSAEDKEILLGLLNQAAGL